MEAEAMEVRPVYACVSVLMTETPSDCLAINGESKALLQVSQDTMFLACSLPHLCSSLAST